MTKTMPTKSKQLVPAGYTISVLFMGMFVQALMAALPASTSSPQEEVGNQTGEAPQAYRADIARNSHGVNSTLINEVTHQVQSDSMPISSLAPQGKAVVSGRSLESQDTTQTRDLTNQEFPESSPIVTDPGMQAYSPGSQEVSTERNDEVVTSQDLLTSHGIQTPQTVERKFQGHSSDNEDAGTTQTNEKNTRWHSLHSQESATIQIGDVKTKRHAHYGSETSTHTTTEATHTTGQFFSNQNVSTAREHSPSFSPSTATTAYTNKFQIKEQVSPSIQDTSTAQTDETQTIERPDTSPQWADMFPLCEVILSSPTFTSQASHCPPSTQLSEQLNGKIEWGFDFINCSQQLFVLNFRVPEDYGFVLEFHHVDVKEGDTLKIYHVEISYSSDTSSASCLQRKKMTKESITSLSPLMMHTNNMQLVLHSVNKWEGLKINVSYTAHPRSSIPNDTNFSNDVPKESKYSYRCDGMTNLPKAISCDGIRHCQNGEDEENCPFRNEGCGDWYPYNDQCLKATFIRVLEINGSEIVPTAPVKAEEACRLQHAATLAAFPDSAGQGVMADMIRKSGFTDAVVGIRRVQPVSPKLSHLYRFLWQWGQKGSPIAYEQPQLQRDVDLKQCAKLIIHPLPRLLPIHCVFLRYPPDGYICMRPNPLRFAEKLTLPGIAFPGASSAPDGFPTKTCPDGSVVQTFHSCQWRRQEEENFVDGLSQNNFPLFQCRYGQTIHFTFLCDGKQDCADLSDETDCRRPQFPPLSDSSFICTNFQAVPKERRCDGMRDCFDGSDEESCFSCSAMILCPGMGCLPNYYSAYFEVCPKVEYSVGGYRTSNNLAEVKLDGYGMSFLRPRNLTCDEGYHQCQEGFCIPTYLFNNGEQDCPKGEDEDIPVHNMTCPGYYRCQGVGTCIHKTHVCDRIHHCPLKDDELYCHLTCPHDSGCVCEGQAYKCSKMINPLHNLHVRYLDLSFAANVSLDDVHFMEYLVFLNLSFCRLGNVTVRDMPQLQTLDLSSNLLTRLSSLRLVSLPGLTYLDLSHNPLVKTLTVEFTAMLQVGELQNLNTLNLINVSLEAIDSMTFIPLSKLKHLDVTANQLGRYSEESLHGPVSLEDLYTDESKLCCPYFHPSVLRCHAPVDELSSCSDLLGKDIFRVCLWTLAVLALVGNIGVLLYRLLVRTRNPLSAAGILVKTLCASDLLMGVYLAMIGVADAQLSGTYVSREREWRSSVMCTVAGVLSLVSSEVSALVICLITLDRVLVLCFPFRPQLHLTPRATVLSCLGVWVAGVVLAVVPLVADLEFYGQTSICIPLPITRQQFSGQSYAFGVFIVFNFVVFLFIGAGQLMIYRAVRKVSAAAGTARRARDTTVARRLFLVVLTDFCCWFPVGVMGLLATLGIPIPGEVNVWAAIFVLPLNSALNPFLYTLNALLERLGKQKEERKMKKIARKLDNEIPKWNAATVQDVMRMCVRSGLVEKDDVDTMFAARTRPLTNKKDYANNIDAADCQSASSEFSNNALDSETRDSTQTTQAGVINVCYSNE